MRSPSTFPPWKFVIYIYIYIYQSTPNTSLLLSEAVLFTHPSNPIHVPSALLGVLHDNQV